MVLQRPVGCEQHATASAWSAAGSPATRPRLDSPVALPSPAAEAAEEVEELANPDLVVLFSRSEYRSLCALRARVQEQLVRGRRPDDLNSRRGR